MSNLLSTYYRQKIRKGGVNATGDVHLLMYTLTLVNISNVIQQHSRVDVSDYLTIPSEFIGVIQNINLTINKILNSLAIHLTPYRLGHG